jgi:hypothetical protein
MVTVPTLSSRPPESVEARPFSGRQQIQTNVEMFGYNESLDQKSQKFAKSVGIVAHDMYMRDQKRSDDRGLLEAEREISLQLDKKSNEFLKQRGGDTKDLIEEAGTWFDSQFNPEKKIAANEGDFVFGSHANARTEARLRHHLNARRHQFISSMSQHSRMEMKAYDTGLYAEKIARNLDSTVKSTVAAYELVAGAEDKSPLGKTTVEIDRSKTEAVVASEQFIKSAEASLAEGNKTIERRGESLGWDRKQIAGAVEEHKEKVHEGVIRTLLAKGEDMSAESYWNEKKSEIKDVKTRTALIKALEVGSIRGKSQRAVEKALAIKRKEYPTDKDGKIISIDDLLHEQEIHREQYAEWELRQSEMKRRKREATARPAAGGYTWEEIEENTNFFLETIRPIVISGKIKDLGPDANLESAKKTVRQIHRLLDKREEEVDAAESSDEDIILAIRQRYEAELRELYANLENFIGHGAPIFAGIAPMFNTAERDSSILAKVKPVQPSEGGPTKPIVEEKYEHGDPEPIMRDVKYAEESDVEYRKRQLEWVRKNFRDNPKLLDATVKRLKSRFDEDMKIEALDDARLYSEAGAIIGTPNPGVGEPGHVPGKPVGYARVFADLTAEQLPKDARLLTSLRKKKPGFDAEVYRNLVVLQSDWTSGTKNGWNGQPGKDAVDAAVGLLPEHLIGHFIKAQADAAAAPINPAVAAALKNRDALLRLTKTRVNALADTRIRGTFGKDFTTLEKAEFKTIKNDIWLFVDGEIRKYFENEKTRDVPLTAEDVDRWIYKAMIEGAQIDRTKDYTAWRVIFGWEDQAKVTKMRFGKFAFTQKQRYGFEVTEDGYDEVAGWLGVKESKVKEWADKLRTMKRKDGTTGYPLWPDAFEGMKILEETKAAEAAAKAADAAAKAADAVEMKKRLAK